MELLDLWEASEIFGRLRKEVASGSRVTVGGLTGSARALLAAALGRQEERATVVLVTGPEAATRLAESLSAFAPAVPVRNFPAPEVLPFEVIAQSPEVTAERLEILERISRGERLVLVVPVEAATLRLPPPDHLGRARLNILPGATVVPEAFARDLVTLGYETAEKVEAPGQWARRGGIIDIWEPTAERPWRLEFGGEEIVSLRSFGVEDQRSVERLARVSIGPARELVLTAAELEHGLERLEKDLRAQMARFRREERADLAEALQERLGTVITSARQGTRADLGRFLPYFYGRESFGLLDYFPQPPLVVFDDPVRLQEAAAEWEREAAERSGALLAEGALLPGQGSFLIGYRRLLTQTERGPALLLEGLRPAGRRTFNLPSRNGEAFLGRWEAFRSELARQLGQGRQVFIFAATAERQERLGEALAGEGASVQILRGSPAGGFELPELGLWVVTDAEIFGRAKRPRRRSGGEKNRLRDWTDLRVGDFVVHIHHGIGRYLGLRTMEVAGVQKEYLLLEYQGEDRLYVPTDQIQLVQKYVGQEGHAPRLNKLGGADWAKVKGRVKESVREMAQELLRLYAIRQARPGHAFGPDTPWQKDLEDSFGYEDTPDQRRALSEIKGDLEAARPMDRLLCGDVGYGKTEVALRAAFKVATEGRQVAVLVPTTILAQQHHDTFRSRFAGFPVRVELLSRFRTPKEEARVLKGLADGTVDVLIGTHRLLGSDVRFRNLGLIIIDEEQRFGVVHKERLKALKEQVDCLTMTATPIPRTLHMALAGLREMSVIETPPEDRLPIQTYVVEYDEELVVEALRREIARSGQSYFVHNRVQDIEEVWRRLGELAPELRVAVAHGQMREEELERTMIRFLHGEYDVLLSTTIIESGLDIPRVNTLVVENADQLGLAQLYQIRGRIGRSSVQAYAFLTYRRDKAISEAAEKRLEAVREFTELGAGFRIAMKDLEIRGAGNILGPEQHGFIVAVGFDMYASLLQEAVAELKGEASVLAVEPPAVEIPVDAFLPASFIHDAEEKIEIYKKIGALREEGAVADLRSEIEDRFGELPPPAENLLRVAALRILGARLDLASIQKENDRVVLRPRQLARLQSVRVSELGGRFRGRVQVFTGPAPYLSLRLPPGADVLGATEELVQFLAEEAGSESLAGRA